MMSVKEFEEEGEKKLMKKEEEKEEERKEESGLKYFREDCVLRQV